MLPALRTSSRTCFENDPKEMIIYTDGCTAQNRNHVAHNALLRLTVKYNVTITVVDLVHSVIERKLKNCEIHLPSMRRSQKKEE